METDPEYYVSGVCAGNRKILAKTITLVESSLPKHQELITGVLNRLLPFTGKAVRLGITGVPGVGKNTFVESLGMLLVERGQRVAILAVDPSSTHSGGSIMGDKTRMEKLSAQPNAFIRPSPSGGTLGGVSRKTRESLLVCEAAGFDVVMVETVGVGQSEVSVASIADFFLLLMLAGAGDGLQGIKRGILELADAVAVNKADGDNLAKTLQAKNIYADAMHLFSSDNTNWSPPILTCSALHMIGIAEVWETVLDHHEKMSATGALEQKRKKQAIQWMLTLLEEGLKDWFYQIPEVKKLLPQLTWEIERGESTPTAAVRKILTSLNN
ncbi:MAG: methylmalonyl Co-A mutase-associated GTPase MeaB [Desulfobacterales bacterium CG23_combo_of_CG06-09_8_20_14_all_51_8]|nr:MAG: methylmalonyl Co-A mutase-associated GTPase MeaB [Desulfobacterales bacterium CG23_combo_of_CG06-09_8_20_14_all_51_8]